MTENGTKQPFAEPPLNGGFWRNRPFEDCQRVNTIYIDAAVNQLRAEGHVILDEDVARLSPLGSRHINMLGRYAFTIPNIVARRELRPLRDPDATGIDDA